MFCKYVTLLAFAASAIAASAIAGAVQPGIYRLTNIASQSTARSYYTPNSPVFVSSTRENPGSYELWDIKDSEGGSYTLKNVGLGAFAVATPEAVIETNSEGTAFNIEAVGNGQFVIKLPSGNLLWKVEAPVIPRGNINLRPTDGGVTERWMFTLSNLGQND